MVHGSYTFLYNYFSCYFSVLLWKSAEVRILFDFVSMKPVLG